MITEQEYKKAVKEYTKNLFRFLYKSLKDEQAVNDIVQDCFLEFWQRRGNVDPAKVKSWLFSVAHNKMINFVKKINRQVPLNESTKPPQVRPDHNFDLKSIIDNALNQLPALQKSIILLRDLEGYEYKEIAEILDINEPQVKVYLFRARQKVKNSLKSLMHVL